MPSPSWEDLDDFFDGDEFAINAIFRRDQEIVAEVLGIFDDPTFTPSVGDYEHEGRNPTLSIKEVSAVGILSGDTVEVNGKTFDVFEAPEADGTGMTVVNLAEQPELYDAQP